MTSLSLIGPSYSLKFNKADCERTVNYIPVVIESGNGKGGNQGYLKQIPGLRYLCNLGGAVRGLVVARDALYAVAGSSLYQVSSAWSATSKGFISAGTDPVGLSVNQTQIAIACGALGYAYDLDAGSLSSISTNWRGSNRVDVLDGFGIYAEPDTAQFYLSGAQDFTALDALDFATAEGSTGNIVSWLVKHRELLILKQNTGEVWYDAGGADFPLSRNDGANIEIGCAATHSLQKIGGVAFWLGRDEQGAAAVFSMQAYQPQRISNHALEELLEQITDLSGATAFTYHQDGLTFYVLNVPGLSTTWVYEVTSGLWHERAELVEGDYQPWRVTCHAFVYGRHVVGDADGNLYELDTTKNTNNGDTLVRDRITPHFALTNLARRRVGSLQIECGVGQGIALGAEAKLMLRYSNDGGKTWGNWRLLSLGKIGEHKARARANMLGAARDRVWHIRVTDDVSCDLLSAVIDEV